MREGIEELKKRASTLRELGDDWRTNLATLNDVTRGTGDMVVHIRRLCKEGNQGKLIKLGLALLAFPEPLVSDVMAYSLIATGLIQRQIKKSSLYLEDVDKIFSGLFKELREIRREMV